MPEELQLLASAGISVAPSDGLVVVGVAVGSDALVDDFMRGAPDTLGMITVARHIAVMDGKAAGFAYRQRVSCAEDRLPGAKRRPTAGEERVADGGHHLHVCGGGHPRPASGCQLR